MSYKIFFPCSTWSGPAWSPAQSVSSVLISIQSLMNEKPYHNEPGFEQVISWYQKRKKSTFYMLIIVHTQMWICYHFPPMRWLGLVKSIPLQDKHMFNFTDNVLNCFKDYKRCINSWCHILNFVQQKKTKFTMEQPYRASAGMVLTK